VNEAKKLKVGEGMQPGVDLGPLISPQAKQRVESLIQSAIDEGAKGNNKKEKEKEFSLIAL
jgi:malonate-semialdehyde dehydrogenase (acetylating) / methylmalonate-semialdehyde dehydrogenase